MVWLGREFKIHPIPPPPIARDTSLVTGFNLFSTVSSQHIIICCCFFFTTTVQSVNEKVLQHSFPSSLAASFPISLCQLLVFFFSECVLLF